MDYSKIFRVFRATILIKGIYSIFQLIAGIVLLIVTSNEISSLVADIFKHELIHDPQDLIANFLINLANSVSYQVKTFIALYLIINSLIKIIILSYLWMKKLNAYPISIAVFILFIIYEIYSYVMHPSIIIIILIILDIIVIILTYLEYKHYKKYGTFGS